MHADLSRSPVIHTLTLPFPILDFTTILSETGRLLVSLDTAWGTLKHNQSTTESGEIPQDPKLSEDDFLRFSQSLAVVTVSTDGQVNTLHPL